MQSRTAKELRPLALPWGIAAAAALVRSMSEDSEALIPTISLFIFFGGIAILSAIPFGMEFQHRSFPLLLAQPMPRVRVWTEKMIVLGAAVASLALFHWQITTREMPQPGMQMVIGGFFLLAVICSAGLWIGRTGSNVFGTITGLAMQLAIFSALHFLTQWIYGSELFFSTFDQVQIIVAAGVVYCALFIWLGWSFWKSRMAKLATAWAIILLLYLLCLVAWAWRDGVRLKFTTEETLWSGMFILAAPCSACFWTLMARSALAGMVFNVASQFLVASLATGAIGKLFPAWLERPRSWFVIGTLGVVYSATFLWLGWRKFKRFEVREAVPTGASPFSSLVPFLRTHRGWLHSRPNGALRNLIRKELCLQKPVVTLAALFTICWIVLAGLRLAVPALRESLGLMLPVVAFIYGALSLLLTGAISVGEEKTSGLIGWHLTLPIPVWRQWLLKMGLSTMIGVLLGVLLPFSFAWITFGSGWLQTQRFALTQVLVVAWLIVTISFWATTLAANTLRGVLNAMLVLAGLFASTSLTATAVNPHSRGSDWSDAATLIFFLALIATLLTQSFLLFRRTRVPPWVWLKFSAFLVGVAVVTYVWCEAVRP